jgi:hypothetical protein
VVALEGKREIAIMTVGDALSAVSASDRGTADCELSVLAVFRERDKGVHETWTQ